jgi:plastocyanin
MLATTSNVFSPSSRSISPGDTIRVRNTGGGFHDLFWDDSTPGVPVASTDSWSSERTFSGAGTYRFYCSIHGGPGGVGMSGVVTVG